jgi:hypothetical protein
MLHSQKTKQKIMKKLILISSVFSIAFVSCKKKDTSTPITYTKADTLQNGQWKLASATAAGGLLDLTTSMSACQKDNLYTFNADKTITVDEGATKCATTDPQSKTDGNWALLNNYAQLSISGASITLGLGALTADVVKLDATTLQIKKDTTIATFPTTAIITFTNVK